MSAISLIGNYALEDGATNDSTATVGEPSLAFADRDIFVTGNWYASRSTDLGASWVHIDPFTTLPSASGGFCCDQVVLHDHARGVWIWILQYKEQDGANVFRLAAARDADFPNGNWYYWDIAPTTLDADWTNLWFDYPDTALTEDNLFVTFNVFDVGGRWQRAAVMRFPLDTIADAGTLVFDSWATTENGSLRLAQGAESTMYWASHNSLQQVRLFRWVDGQGTINWWDIDVQQWTRDIASAAPNGVDWLGRADDRITGASVGNGTICLMWTAGSKGAERPHPYCRVVHIDEAGMRVVGEPDIWSKDRAWAYPAACTNRAGVVGFTAFYGGADRNPGHVVGARDVAGSWTSAYSKLGTHSPAEEKWGDYLTCRAHAPADDSWVAVGYTLEGGEARANIVPRVVHFALT